MSGSSLVIDNLVVHRAGREVLHGISPDAEPRRDRRPPGRQRRRQIDAWS